MHTMTVTLRTVTPLFLGGAALVPSGVEDTRDGPIPILRVPAEIRPPSIRGVMRFWFRALWGDGESRALREREAQYFGSTGTGQCPVRMQWRGKPPESRPWPRGGYEMGVRYLGFTLNTHVKEEGKKIRRIRDYVEPGYEFTLVFRSADPAALKAHWAAIWLVGHLGGIGLRSRRGFGSLNIREVAGCPLPLPLAKDAQSAKEVAAAVGEGLQSLVKELGVRVPREPGAFPLVHQGQPIRIVAGSGDGWGEWDQALNDIGLGLQQFRRELKPVNRRRPFGLPLRASEKERHASPLLIHVGEMRDGMKFASLTAFHSARLMGDWDASHAPPSVVHHFVESLPGSIPVIVPEA
jgi:CRISPR-associated protein Cmr1